ncbi:MAG: amidase family protein [Ilumatobacteraceae bacterium]
MGTLAEETRWLDATAQAELVRSEQVSAAELIEAAIERIEASNPAINAVITTLFDRARDAVGAAELPDGPFRGVPFLLKDLWAMSEGDRFTQGIRALAEAGYTAPTDTVLVERYRAAGLVFLGRTNTPELGILPTTEPDAFGPTRNPWNLDHSSGGSSGGSAAPSPPEWCPPLTPPTAAARSASLRRPAGWSDSRSPRAASASGRSAARAPSGSSTS